MKCKSEGGRRGCVGAQCVSEVHCELRPASCPQRTGSGARRPWRLHEHHHVGYFFFASQASREPLKVVFIHEGSPKGQRATSKVSVLNSDESFSIRV